MERALELVAVHAAYDVHAVLAVLDSLLRQQVRAGPMQHKSQACNALLQRGDDSTKSLDAAALLEIAPSRLHAREEKSKKGHAFCVD